MIYFCKNYSRPLESIQNFLALPDTSLQYGPIFFFDFSLKGRDEVIKRVSLNFNSFQIPNRLAERSKNETQASQNTGNISRFLVSLENKVTCC